MVELFLEGERPPKSRKEPEMTKATATQTKSPNGCTCGCGLPVKGFYKQGHDAKHVSVLLSYVTAGTHTVDEAKAQLPSTALQVKFHNALARWTAKQTKKADKARTVKTPCVVCGARPKSKNINENPELCSVCFEEAGIENDHMDGNHAPGTERKHCPICRAMTSEVKIGRWWYPVVSVAVGTNEVYVAYTAKDGTVKETVTTEDKLR